MEQIFQIGIKGLIRNEIGEILLVHIPAWSGNPAHWDMPGGRMDPGESFLQTLKREIFEEIAVVYTHNPKQLMAFLTNITIPVGKQRVPLVFVVYEVKLPEDVEVRLDPNSAEEEFRWFTPSDAAKELAIKCPIEFCDMVATL